MSLFGRKHRERRTGTTVEAVAVGEFSHRLDRALKAAARYLAEVWVLRRDRLMLSLELDAAKTAISVLREELRAATPPAPPMPTTPSALVLRETGRANALASQLEELTAANHGADRELTAIKNIIGGHIVAAPYSKADAAAYARTVREALDAAGITLPTEEDLKASGVTW